jgi:hypothetical protein
MYAIMHGLGLIDLMYCNIKMKGIWTGTNKYTHVSINA